MAFDSGYGEMMGNAKELRGSEDGMVQMDSENGENSGPDIKREAVDGAVEITFDPDGNTATMILHRPYNGGRPITPATVMLELSRKGITTGIDEIDIKDMVEGKVYDMPICVARAIPAKRGKNGAINYLFEKNRVPKPKHDEFGVANFRELNLIVPIRKGDVIAEITPPTPGEPGINIFGREIKPEPGKMPNITVGKNTLLTADGKQIVSACDGHILYGTGCFNVEDTVTVKADLDLSIGNIDFFGDIHIKGNVMEGFSVKAGRNLKIEGTVFSADISSGGNIVINGGAINSKIDCGGDLKVGFCENSEIKAQGSVESAQFAFCNVFCYGELVAKGKTGVIAGGTITCMKNVTAGIIGSEKYTSTEINIGDGSVICARKREAEAELKSVINIYEQAMKNVEFLKMRKNRQGGRLTDVQAKQMKSETQNKVFYSVRRKELEAYIEELEADLKHRDDLCAVVNGTIFPGSHFCINYLSLDVTEMNTRSKVCIIDNTVQVVPL
ncbi:MAG: DUF342 domain-containing protein [Oscillospiraceae bacterium]